MDQHHVLCVLGWITVLMSNGFTLSFFHFTTTLPVIFG